MHINYIRTLYEHSITNIKRFHIQQIFIEHLLCTDFF